MALLTEQPPGLNLDAPDFLAIEIFKVRPRKCSLENWTKIEPNLYNDLLTRKVLKVLNLKICPRVILQPAAGIRE